MLTWLLPALFVRATEKSGDETCRRNLQAIYRAIQAFRRDHHGEYPTELVGDPTRGPNYYRLYPHHQALVPRYLSAHELLCPLDTQRGEHGFRQPCSYEYELQELQSNRDRVRSLIRSKLIGSFGPRLRLVICSGSHRGNGMMTLRADGRIAQESFYYTDPQVALRHSAWQIEAEYCRSQQPGGPAGNAPSLQPRHGT